MAPRAAPLALLCALLLAAAAPSAALRSRRLLQAPAVPAAPAVAEPKPAANALNVVQATPVDKGGVDVEIARKREVQAPAAKQAPAAPAAEPKPPATIEAGTKESAKVGANKGGRVADG